MRGVILAGGLGTRLSPLTQVTNKHLLPVWDRPMIHYPIENLVRAGIDEILIVTGGQYAGHFLNLLRNGKELGVRRLAYAYQEGEGGIAEALKLARDFVEEERFCVMLGDNLYERHVGPYARRFAADEGLEALVLTQELGPEHDPCRFGLAVRTSEPDEQLQFRPVNVVEKPEEAWLLALHELAASAAIVTGTYFYGPGVFDVCDQLQPSTRGELEITDVNRHYAQRRTLLGCGIRGWWSDAGTFESLHRAAHNVILTGANRDSL
jgi:glucose-1-phosphate thymidylyltransferase